MAGEAGAQARRRKFEGGGGRQMGWQLAVTASLRLVSGMPMIFPGMDPYLENPALWPGVHSRMVIYMADALQLALGTRYIAAVEERVYLEEPPRELIPDISLRALRSGEGEGRSAVVMETDSPVVVAGEPLEIHESFVQLLDLRDGQKVVTVIELLSPTNKRTGPGRDQYLQKQRHTLYSQASLVEIDLLRDGAHTLAAPESASRRKAEFDYAISVHRASRAPGNEFELYPFTLRQRLPCIRVPLAEDDADVALDLQAVLEKTYDAGSYRQRIDYQERAVPVLGVEDEKWAREQLAAPLASKA